MSIRILIADDHGILRAGLRALLNAEPDLEVVGEADSGEAALSLAARLQPDVVLMDLSMRDMDGIEATRALAERGHTARVVVLTVHEDKALLREAIRAGAAGYVVKRAVESELTLAIRSAAGGGLYVHPSLARALFEPAGAPPDGAAPAVPLTRREVEVLQLLAQGYSNRQIADRLHISPRTVETHRANLKAKLHLSGRAELVRYAAMHGLVASGKEGAQPDCGAQARTPREPGSFYGEQTSVSE